MAFAVAQVEAQITGWAPPAELALLVAIGASVYLGLLWRYARPLIEELYTFVTRKQLAASLG